MKHGKLLLFFLLLFCGTLQAQLSVNITITNQILCSGGCNGAATATATGGVPPYSFVWQPGNVVGPTYSGLCAGSYTVTVTDAASSTASATLAITSPGAITATISPSSPVICAGSSVPLSATASGGVPPYAYNWSPSTGLSAVNIANPVASPAVTTTYTLTVTDANGCTMTQTSMVTVNPLPNITVSGNTSACAGSNVTFAASGGITYTWAPGNLTGCCPNVILLTTTTFTVAGTDMNGCTNTATLTVTVDPTPSVTISNVIPSTCNGSTGSAVSNPTGGVGPYTYSWAPSGGNTAMLSNAAPMTYTVSVTGANGCTGTASVTIEDSCDYVWPGDANDDAVANNLDILDIGIANGATGTTRVNANLTWIGQPSADWGTTLLSGTDYKFVDCDGNGVIDPTDTNAVILNYGLVHNNRLIAPTLTGGAPPLSVEILQDSLAANSPGTMQISLGSPPASAMNVYGLAFTISFDPQQIDPASIGLNLTGSWMGTVGTELMGIRYAPTGMGFVDVAITRLDHQNVSGQGPIAQMAFMTTNTQVGTGSGQTVPLTISNVTLISANETSIVYTIENDTVVIVDPPLLTNIAQHETLTPLALAPNPFTESSTLFLHGNTQRFEAQLFDLAGRNVWSSGPRQGDRLELQRGALEAGMYLCKVRIGGQAEQSLRVVVR